MNHALVVGECDRVGQRDPDLEELVEGKSFFGDARREGAPFQ